VNGNPVKTGDELVEAITRAPLGSKVEITYVRDRRSGARV
jgi:S1-C subfamily serine protease